MFERRVVHCDLKPANVKIARDLRFLDFRLAKAMESACRRFSVSPEAQHHHRSMNMILRLYYSPVAAPRHRNAILSAMFLTKRFVIPEFRRKFANVERTAMAVQPQGARFLAAHAFNVGTDFPRLIGFAGSWVWRRHLNSRRMPAVALYSRIGEYPLDFNSEQSPDPGSCVMRTDKTLWLR